MNSGLKYNFKCCNQRYPQSIHAMIRFTEAPVLCFHPAEVKSQSVESKWKENVHMTYDRRSIPISLYIDCKEYEYYDHINLNECPKFCCS